MKKALIFLGVLGIFWAVSGVYAQHLPDLVVTKIECVPPQSKLSFTIANRSNVPLPKKWRAAADVYFDDKKMGHIDLGRPTTTTGGGIGRPGGTSTYLVAFVIVKPVTVKVIADSTNDIRESNEGNNIKVKKLKPCKSKTKCGEKKHEYMIDAVKKRRKGRKYCVRWRERCYVGACYLKPGHAGEHEYSYKICQKHKEKFHEECFDNKEERDARYKELEKERIEQKQKRRGKGR